MTMATRFWAKVKKGDPCWIWTGSRFKDGYGKFRIGNLHKRAHRVVWELTNGAIPASFWVLHRCDNPSCVNPSHLFLGTAAENSQDRDRKGRANHPIGQRHGHAKLTEDQVRRIRAWYAAGNISQRAIGAAFGVSQTQIGAIVRGEDWRHVQAADAVLYVQGGQVEVRG